MVARFQTAPKAVLAELTVPLLVWVSAPPPVQRLEGDLIWKTDPGRVMRKAGDDPVVFQLKKQPGANNAFALGITVGRTGNNDLEIDDASVSRFHAWFQIDPLSAVWHVCDAESSNGTWCNQQRLSPRRPSPLTDGTLVTIGHVDLTFMTAASFQPWMKRKIGELAVSRL
jgi:FHA domain